MKLRNTSPSFATSSAVSTTSLKRFLKFHLPCVWLGVAFIMLIVLGTIAQGQQVTSRAISFPTSIQWTKQKGVGKYRLQIASDETFRNIFFDARVSGERYTVTGLPAGYYFWRTAPADYSTGQFSRPVRFFVSGGAVVSGMLADKTAKRPRVRTAVNSH